MGAANKRGNFEERRATAIARNAKLQWAIENGKDPALKKALKRRGIRPVVATLVMAQVITI